MSATLTRRFLFARKAHAVLHYLHLDLMLAGLIAGIALTNVVSHRFELLASLQAALPSHFRNIQVSGFQQLFGFVQSVGTDKIGRRGIGIRLGIYLWSYYYSCSKIDRRR